MNTLKYTAYRPDGIFGEFYFEGDALPFMVTLSHAYEQPDGSWKPIVMPGTYHCVKGKHALANGVPFETFEITGVEGHSGLLFHPGNFDRDSHGCTLVGEHEIIQADGQRMITNSVIAFHRWLERIGADVTFDLQVIG